MAHIMSIKQKTVDEENSNYSSIFLKSVAYNVW